MHSRPLTPQAIAPTLTAWALLLWLPGPGVAGSPAAQGAEAAQPRSEARLAKRIDFALREGRVAEARLDAEDAVKRFPKSGPIRRRRGQVRLCQAIQEDTDLAGTLPAVRCAPAIRDSVTWFAHIKADPHLQKAEENERSWGQQMAQLERVLTGPAIKGYLEQVRTRLEGLGASLEQRNESLSSALEDLAEARKLGDAGAELELTDLWARVMVLYSRQSEDELERLGNPGSGSAGPGEEQSVIQKQAAQWRKGLSRFAPITREAVLRAAADLARRRPDDPVALAGAADVIAVAAGIGRTPDPLTAYTRKALDRLYAASAGPEGAPASRDAASQLYMQGRDAKDPDAVAAPGALALQLYRRALGVDEKYTLPFLRTRLYLLEVLFEPEKATDLLNAVQQKEPRNAVVPLERARAALLLKSEPREALASCREAARLPEFSRSYLVAVPASLRTVLKFHPALRKQIGEAWPGYGGLIGTMLEAQHQQPALPGRVELLLLQLGMADRLCQALDYADQAVGIDQKTLALRGLADLGDGLSPEQRVLIEQQEDAHERAFAAFPQSVGLTLISPDGLKAMGYPELGPDPVGEMAPTFMVFPSGASSFSANFGHKRSAR